MKILLINQVFYPDIVATAHFLADLATALAERGHEVTVVCSRRPYEHLGTTFPSFENWRGVKICRVFSTRFGKQAKWRRVADFTSFLFFCSLRLLFLPRQDVVVALTTPPLISTLGACRAKLWRARFIYWVMDFNPDEAIAAGWLKADSVAAKVLESLSLFSLRRAAGIIALDRFMRDRILAKQISADKISVIPPWSQDRLINYDARGRDLFRSSYGLNGKFVIMYCGNHSPVHPMDTLMQAADELWDRPDVAFCFIGGGSEYPRIKRWAAGKPNVLCLPSRPLDKLPGPLSAADAQVVVMGDSMLGLVHPCKIYNILAVGAPVVYIGPEQSHITDILGNLKPLHPWVSVRHGDSAGLARHLCQLRSEVSLRIRQVPPDVGSRFSQTALLPRLIALVECPGSEAKAVRPCPQSL